MARGKRVEIVKIFVDGAEVDAKKCTKCGEVKALTAFHKDSRQSSGSSSWCRLCVSNHSKEKLRERARNEGREVREVTAWTDCSYKAFIDIQTNGEYQVVGRFITVNDACAHKHLKCGNIWEAMPQNFLRGTRCPLCNTTRREHEEYVNVVSVTTKGEYVVESDYQLSIEKVKHRHRACGNSWWITPGNFLRGQRCPHCADSRGERAVREYLNSSGYEYEPQYRFPDCRNERSLPFDFVVFYTNSLVAIEYDGEQHFRPVDFAGKGEVHALQRLKETQRNDRIKTEYCRANGITLIRIDYTQFDEIEKILTRELKKLGVTGKRPIAEEEATAA